MRHFPQATHRVALMLPSFKVQRLDDTQVDRSESQPPTIMRQPPSLADPASGAAGQLYSFAERMVLQYAPSVLAAGSLLLQPMKDQAPLVHRSDEPRRNSDSLDTSNLTSRSANPAKLISRASKRATLEAESMELKTSTVSAPYSSAFTSTSTPTAANHRPVTLAPTSRRQPPRSVSAGQVPTSLSYTISSSSEFASIPSSYQHKRQEPRSSSSSATSLAGEGNNGFEQIQKEELGDYYPIANRQEGIPVTSQNSVGRAGESPSKGWWGWRGGDPGEEGQQSPHRSASENDVRLKKNS